MGALPGGVEAPEGPRSPVDRRPRGNLGYNYQHLAAIEGLPTPGAARKALKRALIRPSEFMPQAAGR